MTVTIIYRACLGIVYEIHQSCRHSINKNIYLYCCSENSDSGNTNGEIPIFQLSTMAFSRHFWRILNGSRVAWQATRWTWNWYFDWYCAIYVSKLWLRQENVLTLGLWEDIRQNSFKDIFVVCNLGNELIIRSRWIRILVHSSEIFTFWSTWQKSLQLLLFRLLVEIACRNRR